MNELIKIENKQGRESVNARDLHKFLEISSRFNDWISNRIKKYGFGINIDYIIVTKKLVTEGNDYFITLDMAKELSMVEHNQKGREARHYFILMERKAKALISPELSEAEIVQKALQIQQKKIEQLSIKAQVADEIADTSGLFLPSTVGKMIDGHANKFCQWLVDNKIMFRREHKLIPYASYDKKYFDIKLLTFGEKSTFQSHFTTRGVMWVQAKYLKKNNLLQLDYSENVS